MHPEEPFWLMKCEKLKVILFPKAIELIKNVITVKIAAFNFIDLFLLLIDNNYSIEKVNTLIYNETEGQRLSGEKDYKEIIKTLSNKYPNTRQILTLGKKGSIYSNKNQV